MSASSFPFSMAANCPKEFRREREGRLAEDPSLERRRLASTAASELVRPGRPGAGRASPSEVLFFMLAVSCCQSTWLASSWGELLSFYNTTFSFALLTTSFSVVIIFSGPYCQILSAKNILNTTIQIEYQR
eukprot:m.16637 g.16637  ORF g.16637 m.16637 type:complete len:131 (+) comp5756_c0_seq1:802-1194(+)